MTEQSATPTGGAPATPPPAPATPPPAPAAPPPAPAATAAPAPTAGRPGLVTLIVIYVIIVGLGDLLQGVARIFLNGEADLQAALGADANTILWAGIIEAVVGVVVLVVGYALINGGGFARTLVAIVMVLRIVATAGTVGLNISLDETGAAWVIGGVLNVLLPIFVLWAMYGNDRVDAWFAAQKSS